MNRIQEEYEKAAREKRALDAPGFPAEYIDTRDPGHWVCRCGNTPEAQGFHLWNVNAWRYADNETEAIASTPGYGPTYYYRCDRCFRTIVGPQGYVTTPPLMVRAVWGAEFTPPYDGTRALEDCMHRDPLDDASGDDGPAIAGGGIERELTVAEREAITRDTDAQCYKAGANAARVDAWHYGLPFARERAARMRAGIVAGKPWVPDVYARGFAAELAVIEGELAEVYGTCADCGSPLADGKYCARCDAERTGDGNG